MSAIPSSVNASFGVIAQKGAVYDTEDSPTDRYYAFLTDVENVVYSRGAKALWSVQFEIAPFEWVEAAILSQSETSRSPPPQSPASLLVFDDALPDDIAKALGTTADGLVPGEWYVITLGKGGPTAQRARPSAAPLVRKVNGKGNKVDPRRARKLILRFSPRGKFSVALLTKLLAGKPEAALYLDSALLAATWRDPAGLDVARKIATTTERPASDRLKAISALVAAHDAAALQVAAAVLGDAKANPQPFRGQMLDALGRLDDPGVADVVLSAYPNMEPDLQPRAIELLTQRTAWSKPLLAAVADKKIPSSALSINHVRKLLASKDADVIKQVKATWGTLREERNPQREQIVADMKDLLSKTKGDAQAGIPIFKKLCAQCHKIHGEGQDVGPDITVNGRSNFDLLMSNVFDPSLVIGAAYQATNVLTVQGRSLTGLLVEDSPKRVVLKLQGGKLETIAREDIDVMSISKVSLMPEDVEKQLKPQEIADLFAYLTLDKPPSDPSARKIPGTPNPK